MSGENSLLLESSSNHLEENYTPRYDSIGNHSIRRNRHEKLQIFTSFFIFAFFGIQSQAIGILIPKLQESYKINDLETSFIFLAITSAYIPTALSIKVIYNRVGTRGVLILGCILSTTANFFMSTRPPFPLFITAYFLNGIALGNMDSGLNAWISGLENSNQLLGILHGLFSVGCMISPIIIGYIMKVDSKTWVRTYYLFLLISIVCLLISVSLFKYEYPSKLEIFMPRRDTDINNESGSDNLASAPSNKILKSRLIWKLAFIIFIYVGAESSITSWLIAYLTRIRTLPYSSSSLMATGFWGGLTCGRMMIGFVALENEFKCNIVYTTASFLSIISFWIISTSFGMRAIFVSIFTVGCFAGPIYPTFVAASMKFPLIRSSTPAMGILCASGNAGSAVVPFLIGAIANSSSLGMKVFPLIDSVFFGFLLLLWLGISKYHADN